MLESQRPLPFPQSLEPQNTEDFSRRVVTFKGTLKSYFYFLGLPSSIRDDLNFELKHSQDPRLEYKTTAKTSSCKRDKIIGGKITEKASLNNRGSQEAQEEVLRQCCVETADTERWRSQNQQQAGGQDAEVSNGPWFWEYQQLPLNHVAEFFVQKKSETPKSKSVLS